MRVVREAKKQCKKAVKLGISLFSRGFNSSKCKTMAKLAVARVKLLRNKREVVIRQMRRDIALLLQSGQDATARIRVEHVIREQNIMAANEFIELFCELVVARLAIISKQRECPADLKEGIASLIFAAPRCSDIPELLSIRDIFEKKYGRDFVSAANDLRPNSGVNRNLIEKLSVRTPGGEKKLKVMKEIAKEYQVEWDTTESEMELLKPPEELIEGPRTFVSASSLPVKLPKQSMELNNPTTRSSNNEESNTRNIQDSASAAEAAAKFAKEAVAAAEAAAYLANKDSYQTMGNELKTSAAIKRWSFGGPRCSSDKETIMPTDKDVHRRHSYNVPLPHISSDESECEEEIEFKDPNKEFYHPRASQPNINTGSRKNNRRHSYNAHTDIKFDESDCDEEIEMEGPQSGISLPPDRPAPQVPRGHPKLPDYDELAARFEALKYRKSQT